MNVFANGRGHPLGIIFGQTITFIPAFLVTGSLEVSLAYLFFHRYIDRLNHANVRTNLGILRYVLVTPQSHRIHHSADPAHYDTNFGVSLCIWDRLFGTQCDDPVCPPTGIPDPDFPFEGAEGRWPVLRHLWQQFLYPFRKIAADLRGEQQEPSTAIADQKIAG
ncbi:MAG: sterol desaturase family protein [Alphaproteobacteria bacterium]|nr:sterol desaturase family protein [Alphaproteobacteria bacterium]